MLPVSRLFALYDAVATVNREGLVGDIVEGGVWNGGSIGLAGSQIDNFQDQGSCCTYLTRSGLPQPTEKDTDTFPQFRKNNPAKSERETDWPQFVCTSAKVRQKWKIYW